MTVSKSYHVYILASRRNGTLYVGVTSDLAKRIWEHKNNMVKSFSQKHALHRLVYFEAHEDPTEAILREKRIKKWNRQWKVDLINKSNPEWKDLYDKVRCF